MNPADPNTWLYAALLAAGISLLGFTVHLAKQENSRLSNDTIAIMAITATLVTVCATAVLIPGEHDDAEAVTPKVELEVHHK